MSIQRARIPDKTSSECRNEGQKNKDDLVMGELGFAPIIGLAVLVALAMVAVFGAMSLTNPAQADIGQPADAELTVRTFSPQNLPKPTGLKVDDGANMVSDTWDNFTDDCRSPCTMRVKPQILIWEIRYRAEGEAYNPDDWYAAA